MDLQEFQDVDEFEDQASDLPQSAACGGLFTLATFRILHFDNINDNVMLLTLWMSQTYDVIDYFPY